MIKYSVIIPTYKRTNELLICLNCLAHYFEPTCPKAIQSMIQVVVSDDADDSALQSLLSRRYPWCSYTRGPGRGPAANRNHAALQACGEWLIFTDDDCLPQKGWIESFAQDERILDVMEGKVSSFGTRTRVDQECPTNLNGGYFWSCNLSIRRIIFLSLGGFNEGFPSPAMEDVELRTRIFKHNLKHSFISDALVLHPWRRRKGLRYIKEHAKSVGFFTSLHPEFSSRFSISAQVISLLRSLKKNLEYSFSEKRFSGLTRQILLDISWHYISWNVVRSSNE